MTHVWFLMGISCPDCDRCRVKVFSSVPTEQDHADLCKEMGDMFCIKTIADLAEVDGEGVDVERDG